MKRAFFSWGDTLEIGDEDGNPVYVAKGEVFSWGRKLSFRDAAGRELAYISRQLFHWGPSYEVHVGGELFAEIRKEFTFFADKYTVDVPGPNDYEVSGDFWDYEYAFSRSGSEVAWVSKRFFSWNDAYGIEIGESADVLPVLTTAVVIDLINADKNNR